MFYSQAPWPQCTKLGTNVAKGIICDVVVFCFFSVNPPWVIVLRRGGTPKIARNFWGPASSQHYNSGGVHRKKKKKNTTSQIMPLATFVPSLVRCGQGAWL